MRAFQRLETQLLAQRGHLFCWVPVCLGIGIGGYFALRFEPDVMMFLGLGCLLALGLILARIVRVAFAPLLVGLVLIGAGAGIAKYRTEGVSSPVLGFRYYGAIEGRIINIDRSGSDAVQLTLDRVILNRMSPNRTPSKVRVSVHGDGRSAPYRPGDAIMTTGHLSPPSGPAELGGFDF